MASLVTPSSKGPAVAQNGSKDSANANCFALPGRGAQREGSPPPQPGRATLLMRTRLSALPPYA